MSAKPAAFRPAWWLRGAHAQTLWASLARRPPRVATRRERLELPDGDFIDLDWSDGDPGAICIVLHGLEGSVKSRYAAGMLAALAQTGQRAALLHFRGCSGESNRLPRSYHSGDTADFRFLIDTLRARHPRAPLAAIGFSLGGNVLLKHLGECGSAAGLATAVAVSVPFDLADAAARLERGFSRLYQWRLLRSLKQRVRAKAGLLRDRVDVGGIDRLCTLREFDDCVTAPLHGFTGADHYYAVSSSRQYLSGIRIPTLILHALDDPFMTPAAIPGAARLSPSIELEVSRHGGHVAFVTGAAPWHAEYWLERRIVAHLHDHLPRT